MSAFRPIWPADILQWLNAQIDADPDKRTILNIGAVNTYVLLMFGLTEHDAPPKEATECALLMLKGMESCDHDTRAEYDAEAKRIHRAWLSRNAQGAN